MNTQKLSQETGQYIRSGAKDIFSTKIFLYLFAAMLCFLFTAHQAYGQKEIRIGVLASRGDEEAFGKWNPTAKYLAAEIPGHSFVIIPLDYDPLNKAVESGEVDFLITNPSNYVELESAFGATRIATLKTMFNGTPLKVYGGVIFTRTDRDDITDLNDLEGKKFMAVEKGSLGGWQTAWREFTDKGIDPFSDFAGIEFTGFPHDLVVIGVGAGKADAGTVCTGILESMAAEGKINLPDFRILNQQKESNFPQLLSTRLYPEWAFARGRNISDELSEQVLVALLKMPYESEAAIAASIDGWTVPLDYRQVHELMMDLQIGNYKDYGKLTFKDGLQKFWYAIVLGLVLIVLGAFFIVNIQRTNIKLNHAKAEIEMESVRLEVRVKERTRELQIKIEEHDQAEEKIKSQLHELQSWQYVTLGREERVIELKKEVNTLLKQSGKDEKYST